MSESQRILEPGKIHVPLLEVNSASAVYIIHTM